jgi:glutathione synthase
VKLAFLVNDVATELSEYTTTRLALAAARAGHEVWYVGAGDLVYEPVEHLGGHARRATASDGDTLATFLERCQSEEEPQRIILEDLDVLMLRNDSVEDLHDRSWAIDIGVVFGQMAARRGVLVVNDPKRLSRASSKLYLEEFPPDVRPRCLVTRAEDDVRDFVHKVGGAAVLKPLHGAKGRNVFFVSKEDDPNLSQMIEAVLEDGYVLAQEYLPEAEEGDTRLFLLDGQPLEQDGTFAAFRRVPPDDDLRSNISTGGKSTDAEISEVELEVARRMTKRLAEDGMFFVGIDILGDKVVEINAESPGGFQSVEHFTGIDFSIAIIDALEQKLANR